MKILDMPYELLLLVGENLTIPDLYNFHSTCHQLSVILTSQLHNLIRKNEGGMGALKWAVKHGHGPLADLAISLGADIKMLYYSEGETNYNDQKNSLNWAAFYGHSNVIRILFKHGARVNDRGSNGRSLGPLHMAVAHGRSEATRVLLELGANMRIVNIQNEMPAHIAARGSVSCLQAFIDAGFDLNTQGPYYATVLHIAAHHANIEMVEFLLGQEQMRMAINSQDCEGHTPLHLAILNAEIVKLLLRHGADMGAQDTYGRTPAHRASCGGIRGLDPESLRSLIDAGSDLSIKANDGQTVLHYAAEFFNQQDVMEYLLKQSGVLINAQDSNGETPLAVAANRSPGPVKDWMISLLLQHGADLEIKDDFGRTPADKIRLGIPKDYRCHNNDGKYSHWDDERYMYWVLYESDQEVYEENEYD